ncbi:MAG: hypothetical protein M3268_00935 [Acidobacteriota bacterium]|nr:hypothetical protein [Acidobacteriota bacterium]
MTDSEGRGAGGNAGETPRQEEATSKETLGDLEREEAGAASSSTGAASSSAGAASNDQGAADSPAPSPDGAFDSPRGGRADGGDTGGPM